MGTDDGVVKLLGFEMEVSCRGYHAKDHERIPHEGIRCVSVDEVRELLEVQEVEGLHVGLAVEEVPDRRERTGMGHVKPGLGRSLVSRSILQRTVKLLDTARLERSGEHALVHERQEGVMLLVVPVVVRRFPQVGKEPLKDLLLSGQLLQAPSSLDPELLGSRADTREWNGSRDLVDTNHPGVQRSTGTVS